MYFVMGFSGSSDGKESACNVGDPSSVPGSGQSWRREWQLSPVFLPGEFMDRPWGHRVRHDFSLSLSLILFTLKVQANAASNWSGQTK